MNSTPHSSQDDTIERRCKRLVMLMLVAIAAILCAPLFYGCATKSPERILLNTSDTVSEVVSVAVRLWAEDYHRREVAHKAKPKDSAWFDENDRMIREVGKANELVAKYQAAHKAALNAWLTVKLAGQANPTPEQLEQFSKQLGAARQSLVAGLHTFIGQP